MFVQHILGAKLIQIQGSMSSYERERERETMGADPRETNRGPGIYQRQRQ